MLKGVNRTIIEVKSTDSIYFEKAVFYLRPELRSLPAEFIRKEAEKYIVRKEQARRDYYNFFTLGNWGVASNYDLCLDSSLVGLDGCVDLIVDFGKKANLI